MNPEHKTYIAQDKALKALLRGIGEDIASVGVETAYGLCHLRAAALVARIEGRLDLDAEEAAVNVALFGALQYIEGLFLHGEIEDACKIS
jgi:hypothetical protein